MKKCFTKEKIVGFLKEAEAGVPVKDLWGKHASVTRRSTRGAKFGCMEVSEGTG